MGGQTERAAASNSNDIVEGFSRFSRREKVRTCNVAKASAEEVQSEVMAVPSAVYGVPSTSNLAWKNLKYLGS